MIAGESLRHTGKLLTLHLAEQLADLAGAQNTPEFFVPVSDVIADREQLGRLGHIDTASNRKLLRRDREVEARVAVPAAAMVKARRNVRFVRRLILAETRIPVNAVDR